MLASYTTRCSVAGMLLTSDPFKCFRFVTDNLRSHNGDVQWTVGEWMTSPKAPSAGLAGFHASRTARDSLRHIYGTRWFLAEARGGLDEADDQFAAEQMRLIREIPVDLLRRFVLLCATDCLPYLQDPEFRTWAEASLRGAAERLDSPAGIGAPNADFAIPGIPPGAAASRTVAAVAAAVQASSGAPAWAGAAASAAHAAHAGAAAARAVDELATATASIGNVASGATASRLADRAAILTRSAAAAGAAAHAASAEAATGRLPIDRASDPYYSGWRAWAVPFKDQSYENQASALNALLDGELNPDPPETGRMKTHTYRSAKRRG
jgi:hypothetical protein